MERHGRLGLLGPGPPDGLRDHAIMPSRTYASSDSDSEIALAISAMAYLCEHCSDYGLGTLQLAPTLKAHGLAMTMTRVVVKQKKQVIYVSDPRSGCRLNHLG